MPVPSSRPHARALLTALALVTAAATPGCGPSDGEGGPPQAEQPPAPVEVARARAGELVDEWVFVGEVRSLRSAALALGAGGEIMTLEVREGDRVEAGQLLVEIDKRQASAKLSAAVSTRRESERELRQARREAERAAALGDVLPGEEIERDATRADALEARKGRLSAEIRAAKAQLSDYLLTAPFAGVVAGRYADLGQWVDPGETVLELVATDEVEILVEVRPELAPHVRVGDEVKLRPAGGLAGLGRAQPAQAAAEVLGIVPSLDPRTRTLKIRLRPTQARTWLLPGAPVEVGFPIRYRAGQAEAGQNQGVEGAAIAQAVIVPRDALVLGAIDTRVIVVDEGAAKPVVVEVHASAGDEALVSGAGLSPGAVVVTRGNERLRPGQPVRPIEGGDGTSEHEAAT
ncbi:Multidrug resistance protein MdtA precursor [Enhygromyxa salina]|uniref:Multidrug resistance protein MdtA n=1 Tax=Enhygromyxa salina TaxID=215803 RepID=A0A2S9YH21_9BACT|nr:efflux RND transporter periplasmic adaptor subunit [Enhygromyxa salina]PRQ04415.1 Multidrug resistance protein MdtA precursor [Enhygromyxa salina]